MLKNSLQEKLFV